MVLTTSPSPSTSPSPATAPTAVPTAGGVWAELRPRGGPSRLLGLTALLWAASAVFHTLVFAVDGGPWEGAVSWRKPIVFSASVALMASSVGWLLDRMPPRPRLARALARTVAVAATFETSLVVIQTWRGVPSHFNQVGTVNATIWLMMSIGIVVLSLPFLILLGWLLVERPADPVARTAALWGFALVALALGLGQWLVTLGMAYLNDHGAVPGTITYGRAGVAKFPHAMALHGIQVFAVGAALIGAAGLRPATARRSMWLVTRLYAVAVVAAVAQTMAGRGPSDLSSAPGLVLGAAVVGVASVLATVLVAGRQVTARWRSRDLVG